MTMLKRLICLCLAFPSGVLADAPSIQRPVPTAAPPHLCMMDYPESAVWDGAEGTTIVAFRIGADGGVKNVSVGKSSGHEDLDAAAMGCVGRWTYKPAERDGVAVEVPWQAAVQWKLHGSIADMHPCAKYHAVTKELLAGIGGVTKISFRIMPDGAVKDAEIAQSSGNGDLDQAALRCIAARRFNTVRAVLPDAGIPKNLKVDWRNDLGPVK
jgi:TonB family protein